MVKNYTTLSSRPLHPIRHTHLLGLKFRAFRAFRGFTLCTAPMEMIPKITENCKFENLEKREIKTKMSDFGVKKQAVLHFNQAYIADQCSLYSTSM